MFKTGFFTILAFTSLVSGCSAPPVRPELPKATAVDEAERERAELAALEAISPDRLMQHKDEAGEAPPPDSQCMLDSLNITQGQLVKPESVMLKTTVKIKFRSNIYCTGTLVGPRQVITAAHCLKDETPTEVRFGREPDANAELIVPVKWWIIHPDYDRIFDIGIVLLNEDVPSDFGYARIAKPKTLAAGMTVYYAGYGSTSEENKTYTNSLAWTATKIESISAERRSFSTVIDGKGSCYGDSGGPGYVMDASNSCLLAVGVVNTASTKGNGVCGQGDTSFDMTQATGWIGDSFKILGAPLPYTLPLDGTESAVSRNVLGAPLPE